MVALPLRSILLLLAATSSEGARIARKASEAGGPQTKFVAGVPIVNYHMAFGGRASVLSSESRLEAEKEDWVVMVDTSTADSAVETVCSRARSGCQMVGHPSAGGVPFFKVRGTVKELEHVLAGAAGMARFAEPDFMVQMIPEEERQVSASTALWGLQRVGARQAATSGQGVHVYVTDTGVRTTHEDFGGRAVPALDVSSGSPVECQGDVDCAADTQGHGTHCAGSAAGTTYGVAPNAKLYGVKVIGEYQAPWSWTYAALDWLATKAERPTVASMSLGAPAIGDVQATKTAVDAAVNAGVVVVVAAGNSGADACSNQPAFVPSAITVGSTDSLDRRSSFSNFGSCVDIWAPGSDITSAYSSSDTSTKSMSGTSMATPHVSGGAALLLASNPSWSPAQVWEALRESTLDNVISGLKAADTNKLLYVSAGARPPTPAPAPTAAPTPTPAPATCDASFSTGPDSDGDCKCHNGKDCYTGSSKGCAYSRPGRTSTRYFSPECSNCICSASAPGSPTPPAPPAPAPAPTPPVPPPPAPAPTPGGACNESFSSGPDGDNDCRCSYGMYCYVNSVRGCPYSRPGRTSARYYIAGCPNCICK